MPIKKGISDIQKFTQQLRDSMQSKGLKRHEDQYYKDTGEELFQKPKKKKKKPKNEDY